MLDLLSSIFFDLKLKKGFFHGCYYKYFLLTLKFFIKLLIMKYRKSSLVMTASVCIFLSLLNSCKKAVLENPLANTEWIGMARIPQESEITLKFSNDKADVLFENQVIESMTYTLKNDHIIFDKISGGSPCEKGVEGEYKYEVLQNDFLISLVKDDCVSRTASLKDNGFKRVVKAK